MSREFIEPAVRHRPVLLRESLEYLAAERGGLFVDCTLGLGGHSRALLEASSRVELIGIDRDPEAMELAAEALQPFAGRTRLVNGRFGGLEEILRDLGVEKVDGILADLGVSTMQLEVARRGFSFRRHGPLDMRMGGGETTARKVVNEYSEEALEKIIREYGEERRARRIAKAIAAARREAPLETTAELREVVVRAKKRAGDHGSRIDPATRVFQALRIEVNQELEGLSQLLEQAARLLQTGGRLVVISYHSLEDRIVKNALRLQARGEVDEITGRTRSESRAIEVLTKKPIRPSAEEVEANPRSRSARLRAARRL